MKEVGSFLKLSALCYSVLFLEEPNRLFYISIVVFGNITACEKLLRKIIKQFVAISSDSVLIGIRSMTGKRLI